MKITFFPKSRPGRLSVWSMLTGVLLVLVFYAMVTFLGQRGGETFFSNLYLTIPMLLAYAASCAAFFSGIFAILRQRDRSVLVIITTVLGLLIFLYGMAEIIFPH